MNELDIINLYNNESNKHLENFNEKIKENCTEFATSKK